MPKAPASSRAAAHVTLSAGLMNIPVSVYGGTVSDHGITRKQFIPVKNDKGEIEDHPVGNRNYDKETDENILDKNQIVKKIATEYGFVYVEDGEIEKLFNVDQNHIEIKEFQPQHLFYQGNYVPKSIYFIEPAKVAGKGGKKVVSQANVKALATILKAMKEEGSIAVCEITTRGIPKPAILLPDGTLWEVYHTDALREQRPLPDVELVESEVAMARAFLKALWGDKPLDLTDERSALIQDFADKKARAGDFGKPEETETVAVEPKESADFMALMAASVAAAKEKRASGQ